MFLFTRKMIRQRIEENLDSAFSPYIDPEYPPMEISVVKNVDVTHLYALQDSKDFIYRSFQGIIGRDPSREEVEGWKNMLQQGVPKALLIYLLTLSDEAQTQNDEYYGLVSPSPLHELLSLKGVALVRSAYKSILWREPDFEGLIAHLAMLCTGGDSVSLLRGLAQSEEAKKLPYVWSELEALLSKEEKWPRKIGRKMRRAIRRVTGRVFFTRNLLKYLISDIHNLAKIYEDSIFSRNRIEWQGRIEARIAEVIEESRDGREGIKAAIADAIEKSKEQFRGFVQERLLDQQRVFEERQGRIESRIDEVIEAGREAAEKARDEIGHAILSSREGIKDSIRPPVIRSNNLMMTRVHGFVIGFPADDWRLAAHLTFYGPYEKGSIRAFQKRVREGMVVIDIGANIGIYSMIAGSIVGESGQVFSFEPTPEIYDILNRNLILNDIVRRVKTFPYALSDNPGKAEFGIFPTCGHNSFYFGSEVKKVIEVETTTLDICLKDIRKVDVVKIDAEGAEPLILKGMTRIVDENTDISIFLEFAPSLLLRAGIRPEDFLDMIQSLGFGWHAIEETSGEFLPVSRKELIGCFSCNLLLERNHSR